MKFVEIEKMVSDIVLEHMQNGWMLKPHNTSWGRCLSVTFLEKDGERMAVFVEENTRFDNDFSSVAINVSILPADHPRYNWVWDEEGVTEIARFYNVSGSWIDTETSWFVDTEEEAIRCKEIGRNRRRARGYSWQRNERAINGEINGTLWGMVRRHRGFAKAPKSRIEVKRVDNFYVVSCDGRSYSVSF